MHKQRHFIKVVQSIWAFTSEYIGHTSDDHTVCCHGCHNLNLSVVLFPHADNQTYLP